MSDTAYPNILVVNPDGTISAALSGSLQMPLQLPPLLLPVLSPTHAVRWVNGAADAAQIGAAQIAADTNELIANAISPDGRTLTQISASAKNADAAGNVTASIYDKPSATVLASAQIIDRSGNSSFLQLAAAPDIGVINMGKVTATWSASNLSALVTVPHFLGRIPKTVVLTPWDYNAKAGLTFPIWDAANFYFFAKYDNVVTGSVAIDWIAIG